MEIPATPAAESLTAVQVTFKADPVPAPDAQHARYLGGRLTYYGAVEIVGPGTAREGAAAATSFCLHDVVEVAGELGKTFLAQVEAFWKDSFTGIAYCRARWILRATEIPNGDVSEDEALLTTVSDDIEAANILGLAPLISTPADTELEPASLGAMARPAGGARGGLRSKCRSPCRGKGSGRGFDRDETLFLGRSYDPFSTVFGVLPANHPALVQLRAREKTERGSSGKEMTGGRPYRGRGSSGKSWAGGNGGRAGVVRKGLASASLLVPSPMRRAAGRTGGRNSRNGTSGSSRSSSSSASISSGYSSSNASVGGSSGTGCSGSSSNGEFAGEDSQDDDALDEDNDNDDGDGVGSAPASYHPKTRRGRRRQAAALAAVASAKAEPAEATAPEVAREAAPESPLSTSTRYSPPARPRRLAMPPDETSIDDGSAGEAEAHAATASAGEKRKSLLRGGPLIRAAHAGDNDTEEGGESPNAEEYPQKEIKIGEDHQAEIPGVLMTETERGVERAAMEIGEMGGTRVWSSARDWTATERERLDNFFEQAKLAVDAKRTQPGVPALIGISNGGDRRRKRKVAWAVMAGGAPTEEGKLRVTCAGPEILEVSRDDVRPVQVEELAMHALMQAREGKEGGHLLDDPRPALNLLETAVDDSGPLATWAGPQIAAISEALETHFDFDRYVRSRGHDRHRDEHTDITSLIGCVDGKTPSQVLSFYYRCMATGDALTDVLKAAEAPPKARVERKSMRPRVPPPPRGNPPLNLRHRPSLRCPTRLLGSSPLEDSEDSDSGDADADADADSGGSSSYRLRTRRSSRSEKLREGIGSGRGRSAAKVASGGRAGKAGRPVARQAADRRAPVREEEAAPGSGRRNETGDATNTVAVAVAAAAATAAVAAGDADATAASGYGGARSVGRSSTASLDEAFGGRPVTWVGERGTLSESEGRGCKRALDSRGPVAGGEVGEERVPQRARWQEAPRPSIPADAVIVEVSDDEPMPTAAGAAAADAAAAAEADPKTPADASAHRAPEAGAPIYVGRPTGARVDLLPHGDGSYHHLSAECGGRSPAFAERPDDRRFTYSHATAVDPRRDHRFLRNHPDRRCYDDPRCYNERGHSDLDGSHQHSRSHNLPESGFDDHHRYGYGYGYGGGGGGGRGHCFGAADRRLPPAPASGVRMRGSGVSIWEPQPQPGPAYNGGWNRGGGGGGSDGRVGGGAENGSEGGPMGVGVGSGGGYNRRGDVLSPMEKCWRLVDYARRDGLPLDRVEYLQGLFSAHEKKHMTYRMLSERTDSCLYDREDLQTAFLGIFAQMKLPDPRFRAYRPGAPGARHERAGADYTTGGGYGVSSRAGGQGGGSSGYPFANGGGGGGGGGEPLPSLSSSLSYRDLRGHPALHDEGLRRVAAAMAASKTMSSSVCEDGAGEGLLVERAARRGSSQHFMPAAPMEGAPSVAVE